MRIDPARILAWLRGCYDRILAFAALLVLLVSVSLLILRVGSFSQDKQRFRLGLQAMKPVHPRPAPIDRGLFRQARTALDEPFQASWETGKMFVAEMRMACPNCGKPIPANLKVCTFCNLEVQPPVEQPDDFDQDGIKDEWEMKYGLNPRDATDAEKDADADGFTNLEEFSHGTGPLDPGDHPPPWLKLAVKDVEAKEFQATFMEWSRTRDGYMFQLNTQSGITAFRRLGETVGDYKIVGFEPEFEERIVGSVPLKRDLSVLTLEGPEKTIKLTKGLKSTDVDRQAVLVYLPGRREITVKEDARFQVAGKEYMVKEIDIRQFRALLVEVESGQERWLLRSRGR